MALPLCSTDDIDRIIDTVGRFTSTTISDEMAEQTELIYDQYGDPLAAVQSGVDDDPITSDFYTKFYTGERNIYRVDRVFIGTATKRELTSSTDFVTGTVSGMIKLTSSTTVGGENIDDSDEVIIWYVPKMYKKLCAVRVAEKLIERTDQTSGDELSKELQVIRERKKEYEDFIKNKMEMQLASQYDHADEFYDTNVVSLTQDYDKNKYLGTFT